MDTNNRIGGNPRAPFPDLQVSGRVDRSPTSTIIANTPQGNVWSTKFSQQIYENQIDVVSLPSGGVLFDIPLNPSLPKRKLYWLNYGWVTLGGGLAQYAVNAVVEWFLEGQKISELNLYKAYGAQFDPVTSTGYNFLPYADPCPSVMIVSGTQPQQNVIGTRGTQSGGAVGLSGIGPTEHMIPFPTQGTDSMVLSFPVQNDSTGNSVYCSGLPFKHNISADRCLITAKLQIATNMATEFLYFKHMVRYISER